MFGAITGDIIGSRFEWDNLKQTDFALFTPACRFTDDTLHTVALAESLLCGESYTDALHRYFERYPEAGYGDRFRAWAAARRRSPYGSFGNGAAMRVSPAGWYFDDLPAVLKAAEQSAVVTHDHPEGVRGARCIAGAIFLARRGAGRKELRSWFGGECGYPLPASCDDLRPTYTFDVSCQGTIPAAAIAFLDSRDFEESIRLAVSLGGDSDTIACITGSLAEAFYAGVPAPIAEQAWGFLDPPLHEIIRRFLTATGRRLPFESTP